VNIDAPRVVAAPQRAAALIAMERTAPQGKGGIVSHECPRGHWYSHRLAPPRPGEPGSGGRLRASGLPCNLFGRNADPAEIERVAASERHDLRSNAHHATGRRGPGPGGSRALIYHAQS
jgi:hypothetical protein